MLSLPVFAKVEREVTLDGHVELVGVASRLEWRLTHIVDGLDPQHFATDLHFGTASLSWVLNGYTLAFGGLLLLGGRLGDVFGRLTVFWIGLATFTLFSFLGGLASTFGIPFAQLLIERISWRPTLMVMAAIILGVGVFIHWLFVPGPDETPVPIGEPVRTAQSTVKTSPLAAAVRVPAFWGLVVAFAGYGLAFSAMSFHLIPLLAERKVEIGVVMAIIALIGPMQVVGRVLLMAAQRASLSADAGVSSST